MNRTTSTAIHLGDNIYDVWYTYYPACKGSYEEGGRQLTPDEPPSIEIDEVYLGHDRVDESEVLWERITEKIFEELRGCP